MKKNNKNKKITKKLTYSDEKVSVGNGGETHQVNQDDSQALTTQQGMPIADDQNSLKIGIKGPTAMEDIKRTSVLMNLTRSG